MLDRAIIDHASPTLARLKLGNLFNYPMSAGFDAEFADLQALLEGKGVSLSVLIETRDKALVYIYRTDELEKELRDDRIRRLLRSCGYARFDVSGALETLKSRLNDADTFPHEIGVFLGYPLEDVLGFIENGGRNCLACGCWKVYANECEALAACKRCDACSCVHLLPLCSSMK